MKDTIGFNTKMLHALASYGQREILPPISQVSAFSYESMEELERVFAHKSMGYAYTRIGNPTLAAFEQKINSLEGGIGAISTSSGMAAISAAILNVCESGDEIIVGRGLYGGTIDLFHDLAKLGIHTICARDINDKDELEGLITDRTKLIFSELISNPSLMVLDIPAVSEIAHAHKLPLFVDSTTATPYI